MAPAAATAVTAVVTVGGLCATLYQGAQLFKRGQDVSQAAGGSTELCAGGGISSRRRVLASEAEMQEPAAVMLPALERELRQPSASCSEELARSRLQSLVTPAAMAHLITKVASKVRALRQARTAPDFLTNDELFAIVAYTFDFNHPNAPHASARNLYRVLNDDLRERDSRRRKSVLQSWSGYLYYFVAAVRKVRSPPPWPVKKRALTSADCATRGPHHFRAAPGRVGCDISGME